MSLLVFVLKHNNIHEVIVVSSAIREMTWVHTSTQAFSLSAFRKYFRSF